MNALQAIRAAPNDLARNRLLFDALCDDARRLELYAALRQAGCPVLRVKSLHESGGDDAPLPELYVVSGRADVGVALRKGSVAPYRELDSGGRFMLGLDDMATHAHQNATAIRALDFSPNEIVAYAREAFERAAVRPLGAGRFDLAGDVAVQAALHFLQLLFGLPVESHVYLERMLQGAYHRLTYQIIGRHFAPEAASAPVDPRRVSQARERLRSYVLEAAGQTAGAGGRARPRVDNVVARLRRTFRSDDELFDVAFGLMAGTVGNVRAAVTIAVEYLFTADDRHRGGRLVDRAQREARRGSEAPAALEALERLITRALLRHPPAPFLTRVATPGTAALSCDGQPVPPGSTLLLLMGVQPTRALLFGGIAGGDYRHRCVGEHLAWPLVVVVVREVLRLPGLSPAPDPNTGEAPALIKTWGCICERYWMQYQRDRRRRQQPLFVVLPIKPPYADNARRLMELTRAGAHEVERALQESRIVHFAWFSIVEGGTHLAMSTVFDGDFDAYVEHFAVKVPLFDKQFEWLDVDQPTPIAQHPKAFVETIRRYNRAPLADYFYSAYPQRTVADIEHVFAGRP